VAPREWARRVSPVGGTSVCGRFVTRPYAGITGAIEQTGGFVFPATASVLLVMKVEDPMLAEATRLGIDTDALVSLIRGAGSNNGGKSR